MELRIVYRILRKVSDWALVSFYSETYVDSGEQNVPKNTPIIITPCHHNELIDVATLAATIPHRRKVSFWAKSTTFSHPVLGPILSSSGAIPVRRNPDKVDSATSNAALFDASTAALARNQVIGVFPEGTSYTEPAIAQILSGAAWAALEFMRSQHKHGKTGSVVIIPVGIVYTNKSKFRSRVHVEYGLPIDMASYTPSSLFESPDPEAERAVVKAVMKDVEVQILERTINAPDWETLYAAQMTRSILWGDERNVKLKDWLVVSQMLVRLFSPSSEDAELVSVKRALTKYFSLLHYTNLTHAEVDQLIHGYGSFPAQSFIFRFLLITLRTLLHPSFLLFIPAFITHIPAYLFAGLGSKYLAPPGEEESQAQFKVILGGIGAGLGAGVSSYWVTKLGSAFKPELFHGNRMRGKILLWALTAWILGKWHWALVDSNYRRFRRLCAVSKILLGVLQPRSWDLSPAQLTAYETPPAPAANPFLKQKEGAAPVLGGRAWLKAQPRPVPSRKIIFHLLLARRSALSALAMHSSKMPSAEKRVLVDFGGVFPE
ncbi:glycerol-3-phosphate-1-acyltransferase [Mycena metata]|uniref:Glycerol-3-phosphate-1-acyltransferase n=1 Tax=Mycena metata TaxID=1033252 RepID=A0AAD7JYW2_9AGAR|nr:glycerol-3-phosphate-1-acyltransferase [Mycena metata]